MANSTNFTAEQEQEIQSYVKQGTDRQTAERIVRASARNRRPADRKGNLNGNQGFSLLR